MLVKTHQFTPKDEVFCKRMFFLGFLLPILWLVNILYFQSRLTMGFKTFHTSVYLSFFTKDTEQPNRFLTIQSYVFYSKLLSILVFAGWLLWLAFFQWKTSTDPSEAWTRWQLFEFTTPNPYDPVEAFQDT